MNSRQPVMMYKYSNVLTHAWLLRNQHYKSIIITCPRAIQLHVIHLHVIHLLLSGSIVVLASCIVIAYNSRQNKVLVPFALHVTLSFLREQKNFFNWNWTHMFYSYTHHNYNFKTGKSVAESVTINGTQRIWEWSNFAAVVADSLLLSWNAHFTYCVYFVILYHIIVIVRLN